MLPTKDYAAPYPLPHGFYPGIQIIIDALESQYGALEIYHPDFTKRYLGIRFLVSQDTPSPHYLYLAESHGTALIKQYPDVDCVLVGEAFQGSSDAKGTILHVHGAQSLEAVSDYCHAVFERIFAWDRALIKAMDSQTPLDNLIEASNTLFDNPIFVHDRNFFILSCPWHVPGMLVFQQDMKSRKLIIPPNVINEFKLSEEYQHTLTTHGPDMYSADHRGFRILYINLWQNNHYLGRICVDELASEIKPGDAQLLDHLAHYVLQVVDRRNRFWVGSDQSGEQLFTELLRGQAPDPGALSDLLHYLSWEAEDAYLCLKLYNDQMRFTNLSSSSTAALIESHVTSSYAFFYEDSIAVVVNLTHSGCQPDQVMMNIAVVLREYLLKMGMSNVLPGIHCLGSGFIQAAIALDAGQKADGTIWRHQFKDYALSYMLTCGEEALAADYLADPGIIALHRHDVAHQSHLYTTLQVYLDCERNLVKTSEHLGIHRSTLIYRLSRIKEIIPLDLDSPRNRTYLKLSFLLLNQKTRPKASED